MTNPDHQYKWEARLPRIKMRANHHHTDGRLLVEAGAIGTGYGDDRGRLTVKFDESEHYVELSGCGERIQFVDFLDTVSLGTWERPAPPTA